MPNPLLQQAEGLADFGGILVFIFETLKTRQIYSRFGITLLVVANHQIRLRVFQQNWLVFARMNLKPAA